MDWTAWHADYADRDSDLSRRRRAVQAQVNACLDIRTGKSLRVVSACAGDGGDVLGVLAARDDSARVRAVLLETDPELAGAAEASALRHDLGGVVVRRADAGCTDSYVDAVPAGLVMFCGVFGNLSEQHVRDTIAVLPQFCDAGASVLWTRGRFASGDLTPTIRSWFAEEGFVEVQFEAPTDTRYRVGHHRWTGSPGTLQRGQTFFVFNR